MRTIIKPDALNYNLVANLVRLGFSSEIYPVNPNPDQIFGIKAYPDLKGIKGDIDLIVSAVTVGISLDIVNA